MLNPRVNLKSGFLPKTLKIIKIANDIGIGNYFTISQTVRRQDIYKAFGKTHIIEMNIRDVSYFGAVP